VWDRQYISSLVITLVAGFLVVGALVVMLAWLGWTGALGLLAIVAGFLLWFYCGPRPDLRPSKGKPGG
jgi:1,4-dihydroxy-2-naphthoate octaprenyltransferase